MKRMLRVIFLSLLCFPHFLRAQCPVVDFGPDTLICVGTSITLNAENAGATYLWSDGSTAPQLETFFEGEYSVEVTLNGCVARDTIYVAQGPVIQADFFYMQTSSCSPFITGFTQLAQACSASITEWSWNFGDGSTSTDPNPVHIYATPGDYVVTLMVKSNKGSIYTTQQTVTISGTMTPVVNLGNDINLCFGNELILNAQNAGATYAWNTGETTQSITVLDGGAYTVTVTKNGCSTADSINVISVPALWSDFTFQKVSGCMPVKFKFTDNSSACESTITGWLWDFGDGITSTQKNPEHDFSSQAQFNVKLTITDNFGNSIRRSKKVTVEPSNLTVNIGPDTTVCFGTSLILDAGVPGATYAWSTGETTQQISVADDGEYTVAVNSEGCIVKDTMRLNTSASVLNKWSYTKGVECLPVQVNFHDSSVAFCGQSVDFWYWDFGDGAYSTEQHPVHNFMSADTFAVRLTIITTSGNMSTTTKKIGMGNTLHKVDLPSELKVCTGGASTIDAGVPDAEYTWSPSFGVGDVHARATSIKPMINSWYYVDVKKCMVDVKDSVYVIVDSILKPGITQSMNTLTATASNQYEWYLNDVKIEYAAGKTLRIDRDGFYAVKIINKSGCERMSDPQFFMPFSGKEKEAELVRVKCSPNPSNGSLNVLISQVPEKPAKLTVYDSYGRILHSSYVTANVTPLNMLKLAKGLYYVEVNINNKKNIVPVVIQ
jgi:PKD repeat protein